MYVYMYNTHTGGEGGNKIEDDVLGKKLWSGQKQRQNRKRGPEARVESSCRGLLGTFAVCLPFCGFALDLLLTERDSFSNK